MAFRPIADCTYNFEPSGKRVEHSPSMYADFHQHGYVIVKNMFTADEIDRVNEALMVDERFWKSSFSLHENPTVKYDQVQWKDPGTDIFGRVAGNERTVGVCEYLLDKGELYLYHGKVIMKPAATGSQVHWHQDYGYWYNNRAPFPHFITCIIALTKSDRENGGVQVMKGSHLCGRINHTFDNVSGAQQQADPERVDMLIKNQRLPVVHADLAAGDCIIFHANTLHRSDANTAPHKRWNLIYSYNARMNTPDRVHYNACYGEYKMVRFPADSIMTYDDYMKIDQRDYGSASTNPNIRLDAGRHQNGGRT